MENGLIENTTCRPIWLKRTKMWNIYKLGGGCDDPSPLNGSMIPQPCMVIPKDVQLVVAILEVGDITNSITLIGSWKLMML